MTAPGIGLLVALLKVVGRLALPAEAQIAYLHDRGLPAGVDELALELHDGAVLLQQFEANGWLNSDDVSAIRDLDELLQRMSGQANQPLWTEEALFNAPEWREIRRQAQHILAL